MKTASSSLASASSNSSAAVYGRNKRPSPNSAIELDPVPNKRKPEAAAFQPVPSTSTAPPVASTSSPSPVVRPALRRTTAERELHALLEPEYRDEVHQYMYDLETRTMASVELIDMQPELQWYMRPYLVDFLIEVHQQHALRPETLYLAINIVDRYVSKRIVFKKHFQLVGCASLWIAAKFEDAKDRVPTVQDLCQSCCGAYEESAFVQMEGHVLSTIGWVIGHPTAEAWLRMACIQLRMVEEQPVQHLARFLMEVTLFHRGFVAYKPSDIAAGVLLLSRCILGRPPASPSRSTSFLSANAPQPIGDAEQALRIAQLLDGHFADHLEQVSQIVVKKYAFTFYSKASSIARDFYLNGGRFVVPVVPATPTKPSFGGPASSSPLYARGTASFADMSPSSASDCSSSDSEDNASDCDYDEPITPITPMSSCSLVNPMDALATAGTPLPPVPRLTTSAPVPAASTASANGGAAANGVQVGKENLPRTAPSSRPSQSVDACAAPAARAAFNEWDPNANAMTA